MKLQDQASQTIRKHFQQYGQKVCICILQHQLIRVEQLMKAIINYSPLQRRNGNLFHVGINAIFILTIMHFCVCGPILGNKQIVFKMSGATTYIPDTGGTSKQGYKLRLGYQGNSWLGVEIITGTDKNDVIILELDQFYTQGSTPLRTGHQVSITDFYRTGDTLNYDQNTQNDISSFSYVEQKQYTIDLTRYMGSNSGEDWNAAANGYQLIQVCFYSSEKLFSISTWRNGISQCYYFQVDNYVSEFKGVKLKNFYINGYSTGIYGWIDGPYVTDNLYLYHKVPLFTYTKEPAIVFQLGTTQGNVGQDFNAYSPVSGQSGDYYGASVTSMTKDSLQAYGYQNGGLTMRHWNAVPASQISGVSFTALRINYRRNITTFDSYDKKLKSTFIFCAYLYTVGSINSELTDKSCDVVELSYHYLRLEMPSKIFQQYLSLSLCMIIVIICGIALF